ncbi:MAG: antibiotic biosynthesis monooxygenase [Sphingopyxis sp.]|nr:antibiotic biosynthesis monooxygenase [Sphingopyxis sp.]
MPLPCPPVGATAVIFLSQRSGEDDAGYAAAATAMEALAARQPGYVGFIAARGGDGIGIAVSYWADDAAARAWRDQPDHARIREQGRLRWYQSYSLAVATVARSYEWGHDAP